MKSSGVGGQVFVDPTLTEGRASQAAGPCGRVAEPGRGVFRHGETMGSPSEHIFAARIWQAGSSSQVPSPVCEVQLVSEATAGLKAAFHEVLQALDDALGLRVTRIAEVPVDAQLPAEGGELDRRSAARRVQAGLVACSTLTEIRKITRAILLGSPAPAPGVTGTVGVACVEADAATYGTLRPQEIAPGVLVRWTG